MAVSSRLVVHSADGYLCHVCAGTALGPDSDRRASLGAARATADRQTVAEQPCAPVSQGPAALLQRLGHVLATPGGSFRHQPRRTGHPVAVILLTNSYANGSAAGTDLQAVLMSIYRTLKQHSHNSLGTMVSAVRTYLQTGKLLLLPGRIAKDG